MRASAISLSVLCCLLQVSAYAQQPIERSTSKIEEKLAILNAGRIINSDDTTVYRFRFLIKELKWEASQSETDIGDILVTGQKEAKERFGKNVGLLDLAEAAYRTRSSIKPLGFAEHIAKLVVLIGKQ